jgi:cobalt-precorrin 5A hydrolase / precorrin-3B C17-methyltransferase
MEWLKVAGLMTNMQRKIAIVALSNGSIVTAKKIQTCGVEAGCIEAVIYGLRKRVDSADIFFDDFGNTLRDLYRADTTIIALCAAGIIIRTLAPLLEEKSSEPPVLAVAEDGSAVVPLLGGIGGVNDIAREIAAALNINAAITTSGELRFGTCLLNPPEGYVLADIEQGKRFVSDLLSGQTVRVEGDAFWLRDANLPLDASAHRIIRISPQLSEVAAGALQIYPRSVIALIENSEGDIEVNVREALQSLNIAPQALACVVAKNSEMINRALLRASEALEVPLRFTDDFLRIKTPGAHATRINSITLIDRQQPVAIDSIGQPRGVLTVIGLGPGASEFMIPAAREALTQAEDILGYETYVKMAGPFQTHQVLHCTDNREEMQRARHAFELAAQGRRVVVVSSGDPGVFAMAAAVLEALHESNKPNWHVIDLQIYPGVSAAFATAARAGAPLGHDFCVMSLSDNLKPWEIIETRLDHAAAADFVLAFYNPISKARPWQLGRALEIIARHRSGDTVVVLGRDVGRPDEKLQTLTLAQLTPEQVDMRTMVIIGSSATQCFARSDNTQWVYTPRWYK